MDISNNPGAEKSMHMKVMKGIYCFDIGATE